MKAQLKPDNEQEAQEITDLDNMLREKLGKDRAFILLYERKSGKSASVHRNLTAVQIVNGLRNMADFVENWSKEDEAEWLGQNQYNN